jgi:hypothetical protein
MIPRYPSPFIAEIPDVGDCVRVGFFVTVLLARRLPSMALKRSAMLLGISLCVWASASSASFWRPTPMVSCWSSVAGCKPSRCSIRSLS